MKIVWLRLGGFFTLKIFSWKKINRLKIALITSYTILLWMGLFCLWMLFQYVLQTLPESWKWAKHTACLCSTPVSSFLLLSLKLFYVYLQFEQYIAVHKHYMIDPINLFVYKTLKGVCFHNILKIWQRFPRHFLNPISLLSVGDTLALTRWLLRVLALQK